MKDEAQRAQQVAVNRVREVEEREGKVQAEEERLRKEEKERQLAAQICLNSLTRRHC